MGWAAIATAVIGEAMSDSGGSGGGTTINTDAYKGDGAQGTGQFLLGVAKAYGLREVNTVDAYNRLHAVDKQRLDTHLQRVLLEFRDSVFTKGAAKLDSEAAVDAIFKDHRERDLPKLYGKTCAAGLYNCSSMQMLANDAYARTVVEASKVKLDWITSYARTHLQESSNATQILGVLTQVYEDRNTKINEGNKPDISQIAKDGAKYLIFMGVLDWMSRRAYFADKKEEETTTVGGIVGTVIDAIV